MAEAEATTQEGGSTGLLSIEGIIFLPLAIFFDALAILLSFIPVIGWLLGIPVAIAAFLIFHSWMWLRSHMKTTPTKAVMRKAVVRGVRTVRTAARAAKYLKWLRWITPIAKAIPFLNIIPFWTILTYLEVKYL